jgi:DNA-binding response OmpR family regulator
MLQDTRHTVLLIEADKSLRRLIALGLQNRGMYVIEASSPTNLPTLEPQLPDVAVLDIDGEAGSNHALLSTLVSQPYFSTMPLVILAWDCQISIRNHQHSPQPYRTCLAKPFDARTLHTTIEQIQNTAKENKDASSQELLLAKRSVTPTPSIWPLNTAAGLVLAFIGLMTQITLSALGLLVLFTALLWWALGTRPEPLAV